LKIDISQGTITSVATQLRCCGIFSNQVISQIVYRMYRWKKFENRSIFGDDMDKVRGLLLWATLYAIIEAIYLGPNRVLVVSATVMCHVQYITLFSVTALLNSIWAYLCWKIIYLFRRRL